MRGISLSLGLAASSLVLLLADAPAHAQATRTWVSGVGDDANPCSRTAPCKTFAGAISKTFINGEISCLDPGGFGAVTITKSITIDCHEILASILASGTNGIIINIAANANDPLRTVRLRNISINGTGASGAVGTRTGINGIRIDQALNVFVEDMLITGFSQRGILDQRSVAGKLYIKNSTIRDNAGPGIAVAPSAIVEAKIVNVHSELNSFGIAVGANGRVMVSNSTFTGNSAVGVEADPNGSLTVSHSVMSSNGLGVQAGGGSFVRLSNNDITFNGTAIGGATLSFGNNRIAGNTAAGTAPTPVGADSHDKGQQ
ncbi:MAG TPA: right-handed parallel beta-helix repeat-containing protein [Xanthobacteraceae bacterium]|nr:right-handed parallel beta-helix repeat-containing protein [Xanthobacteraceae bacterium]